MKCLARQYTKFLSKAKPIPFADIVSFTSLASQMSPKELVNLLNQMTAATYERLKKRYLLEEREAIAVKSKGEMITYWLIGTKMG